MTTEIIVALIAAIAALLTSIVSVLMSYLNSKNQQKANRDLAALQSKLQSERDEDSSRRSYMFEGKKRLYEEYEPIRFQMTEAILRAAWRVQSIARSARNGDIKRDGSGWLSSHKNYFAQIVIYDLMLPAVWFRIMKRQLTSVDFSLDQRIAWEYILAKSYYYGFTNDFWVADIQDSKLEYDPNNRNGKKLRIANPQQYWRQGYPIGWLDSFLEQMTLKTDKGYDPMSFGMFNTRISNNDQDDQLYNQYRVVFDVFHKFHPSTRPVLWRVLLYLVIFSHAYYRSWKDSREDILIKPDYDLPTLEENFINKYAIDKLSTTKKELEVIQIKAKEDIHNSFSL